MNIRIGILLTMLCAVAEPSYAQENASSFSSAVPDYARYEVVQSPLLAKLTIRLDRFTGDTWQFVETTQGRFAWERMPRIPLPNDIRAPRKVNYQIFLSVLTFTQD